MQGVIDLSERELAAHHKQYCEMFTGGIASMSLALAGIRREETFRTEGYSSFRDFVAEELPIGRTAAEVLANAGATISMLEDRDEELLSCITSAEIFRPIHTWDPERQLRVLQMAVEEAPKSKSGRPMLTGKVVEETAIRHFGKKRKKKSAKAKAQEKKPQMLKHLEKHLNALAKTALELKPSEAIEAYGPPWKWDGFQQTRAWLNELNKLAPSSQYSTEE